METSTKNDSLKYIISRYDNYFQNINTKGNFYITVNTFILASTITGYFSLNEKFHFGNGTLVLFIIQLVANLFSFCCTLLAIKPFLNGKKDNDNGSVIFFGDVADYHVKHYEERWERITDDVWHNDLKRQAYLLSLGVKRKYILLGYATWLIAIQILTVILFSIKFLTF